MADETPLTNLTTSDRCPACSSEKIAERDGAPPSDSVQVWRCLQCGLAFYRYRWPHEAADGGRRRPPIGGGGPARRPWVLVRRRPAHFVDELVAFGAEVLRETQTICERAVRETTRARRAIGAPRG
jgi:hypothetical protein